MWNLFIFVKTNEKKENIVQCPVQVLFLAFPDAQPAFWDD